MPDLTINRGKLLDTEAVVVRCEGVLDAHTLDRLETELGQVLDEGARLLAVDLREVSYCSSRGIGILVRARKEIVEEGGAFVLVGPTPAVATVLEILGFDDVFDIVHSDVEAAEALGLR